VSRCSVCAAPQRAAIDQLLIGGRSGRSLAVEFGLSIDAMKRHARNHVVPSEELPELPPGADPLDELVASLRTAAVTGKNPSAAREYRLVLALQAERRNERPAYDVVADPTWIRLRTVMLDALKPFPEARLAVADALRSEGAL
jgi:hypothetical protein